MRKLLNSGAYKGEWKPVAELVKSLTPGEKGYFRKYCGGFAKNKSKTYLKIFDILDASKEVTDDYVRRQLGNGKTNIHSLRSFLYKQILKSLRVYHTEKNTQSRLREMLDYADILSGKGLYEQSRAFIDKGVQLSDPVTLPAYLILFQTQQIQLLRHYSEEEKIKKTDEIVSSIVDSADVIKHAYVSRQGLTKALYYVNTFFPLRNAAIKKDVLQLLHELEMLPDTQQQNYRMRNTRNAAISLLYRLLNDWDNAILYQEKTIHIIENLDTQNLNRNIPVISAYYNYISLIINKGDTENFEKQLKKLQTQAVSGKTEERYLQAVVLQLQLDNILFNKQFSNAEHVVFEAEKFLQEPHPIPSIYLDTLMRLTSYYIYQNNNAAALEKINILLQSEYQHTLQSFPVHVRLVNIVIHYELGNTLVLPALVRNTYRYMLKQELKFSIENILLNFFRKVLNHINAKQFDNAFKKLSVQFALAIHDEYEQKALNYFFDYQYWLHMKMKQ